MNIEVLIKENGVTTLATEDCYCPSDIDLLVDVATDTTAIYNGSVSGTYEDDNLEVVRFGGFAGTNYDYIRIQNCKELKGSRNFADCENLLTIDLPSLTTVVGLDYTFQGCDKLRFAQFENLASAPNGTGACFYDCFKLQKVLFPKLSGTTIGNYTFRNCVALETIVIGGDVLCPLNHTNAFGGANNWTLYVKDELVDAYKSATNWSNYPTRIKGISELPSDAMIMTIEEEEN